MILIKTEGFNAAVWKVWSRTNRMADLINDMQYFKCFAFCLTLLKPSDLCSHNIRGCSSSMFSPIESCGT
jgi:hypothetical protein